MLNFMSNWTKISNPFLSIAWQLAEIYATLQEQFASSSTVSQSTTSSQYVSRYLHIIYQLKKRGLRARPGIPSITFIRR